MSAAVFGADLLAFSEKTDIRLETVTKKVTIELHDAVILKTPVDTGRARSNWNVAAHAPDLSVTDEETRSLAKARAKQSALQSAGDATVYHITNNLEYIEDLENGTSDQAPFGMVKVTMAEKELYIEQALQALG